MGELTYMVARGGPMMYAVLAGVVLTLGLNFILVAVLAFKKRVPAPLFLIMPGFTLALGAAGWAMGLSQLLEAVPNASLEMRDSLTFSGLSIAPLPMWLALVCCAVLFALTAAAAGLTVTIGAGKEAKWQFGGPIGTVLIGALGLVVVTLGALTDRGSAVTLLLPAVGLVAGTGVILVGLRLGKDDKDAQRCAAGRAFVGACALIALGCATVAAQMHGVMMAQGAIAQASAESLQSLMAMGLLSAEHASKVGAAGLAVMFLAHVIPVMGARQHLFKTFTLISATFSLMAILSIAALHVGVAWWSSTVVDSTMMFRAVEVAEQVPGLPAPAEIYSEQRVSHFETVITYSGGRWTREDQPLDRIDPYDPEYVALLATPATTSAQSLLDAQSLTAGGPELDRYIRILVERPPYMEMPDSPYFHWGLLGVVTFELLPLSREIPSTVETPDKAAMAEDLVESSTILSLLAGLDDPSDMFAEPAPGAAQTLVVFDGAKAGNATAWGVDERSRETWVAGPGLPARAIGKGEAAREMLRSLVGEHHPTAVLFVPGEQWTVQDLVDLALYAYDEVLNSWDDWSLVCQIDAQAPAPH